MQSICRMRLLRALVISIAAIVLVACGTGDGQEQIPGTPQPTLTGVLVDSVTEVLRDVSLELVDEFQKTQQNGRGNTRKRPENACK